MQYETTEAFHELVDLVKGIDQTFLEGERAVAEPADVLDGYKWILSVLQVATETQLWADTNQPSFIDIVGPYKKWGGDNADAFYCFAPIDPEKTYRVTGNKGDAEYISLTVYGGPRDGRYSDRIVGTLNDRTTEIGPDGSFEMILSPREHDGAWMKLDGDAVAAITREYFNHPESDRRARWKIECLDPSPYTPPTDADTAARLRAVATWIREMLAISPTRIDPPNHVQDPYASPAVTYGWAAGDAAYAMGSYDLGPGEALVIKGRSPGCAFWNACLWNPFLHTYDYRYQRVTLNGAQCVYEEDGSWTIVVSPTDTGHPNWISTAGRRSGLVWFRWFYPDATPEPLETKVVPVAEAGA